jgi:nitrogen regulatory protein P-II 1
METPAEYNARRTAHRRDVQPSIRDAELGKECVMIKIEAIIRPEKLEVVQEALEEAGIHGLTVTPVRGQGKQRGVTHRYRGAEYTVNLIEKTRVEVVVPTEDAHRIAQVIAEVARTGEIGDGKIFLIPVEDAIRVRTGEKGHNSLI